MEDWLNGRVALRALDIGVSALEGVDVRENAVLAEGVAAFCQRVRESEQATAELAS